MSRETLKTLFHPFASGVLTPPDAGQRWLFLGAEAGNVLPESFDAEIFRQQGLRPEYLRLQATNHLVSPTIGGEGYDGALVLCGKHRGENENRIAEALKRVRAGGWIVFAGGKEDGIQSMRKRLTGLGFELEHMPKYHGVAVWLRVPDNVDSAVDALATGEVLVGERFHTFAGMFSHDRVDEGSELLASRLPADFSGNAADFGAGWGYLSAMLAERAPRTASIDLFEADYQALECAKKNLADLDSEIAVRFHWHDLVSEPIKSKFDLIMMNPPFHQGHAAEPSLGQAFIRAAAGALRPGGTLMLVANRGLPYESVLAEAFRNHGETCRNARFKLLWAKR